MYPSLAPGSACPASLFAYYHLSMVLNEACSLAQTNKQTKTPQCLHSWFHSFQGFTYLFWRGLFVICYLFIYFSICLKFTFIFCAKFRLALSVTFGSLSQGGTFGSGRSYTKVTTLEVRRSPLGSPATFQVKWVFISMQVLGSCCQGTWGMGSPRQRRRSKLVTLPGSLALKEVKGRGNPRNLRK